MDLRAAEHVRAVGLVDVERGAVLAGWSRSAGDRQALDLAAGAACHLFHPSAIECGDDGVAEEAVVVSSAGVHAFARCAGRGDRVAVGVAAAGGNVALLLATVRGLRDEGAWEGP